MARWRSSGPIVFILVAGTSPTAQEPVERPAERRADVAALAIEGVSAVSAGELREALQTRAPSWLPWKDDPPFEPEVFAADLERIPAFYAERGYPHARVVDSRVTRMGDGVRIHLVIDEGAPVRVASVDFTGFEALSAERMEVLRARAPAQPGGVAAQAAVAATARLAADALGEAGYAYARLDVRQRRVAPDRVAVEIHAEPGSAVVFGPIQIAGNHAVDDAVIRRQLAYRPGEPFRLGAMTESQRRLRQLGLFESVLIEVVDPGQPMPHVPTTVTVQEAKLHQFAYSFGYGSEERLHGELQWRHLNAFGGGRTVGARGRWSSIDRGGEGFLSQPYLWSPRLSLQVSGASWQVSEPVYRLLSSGGGLSLSRLLGRFTRVTASYRHQYQRSRVREEALRDPELRRLLGTLGLSSADGAQRGLDAAIGLDMARDTTAAAVSPRSGYRLLARVEKGGGWLPGAFDYGVLSALAGAYVRAGPLTLAGRAQLGTLPASSDADVPFSRRYYLGGADTLRGWGRHEVSPLSPSGRPIGGRSLLAVNAEVRVPMFKALSGVGFLDAGNVWADPWELHLDRLRSNAGAGLRLGSPFGLLRLDLGYQLTPIEGLTVDAAPAQRRWRIHLSAGQAF